MCDKMAISAYILKIVENDPFLRLQMRAKEMLNCDQFFSTNKQYLKIKLMQNELGNNKSQSSLCTPKTLLGIGRFSSSREKQLHNLCKKQYLLYSTGSSRPT